MTSVKKAFDSGAIPASQSEHLSYAKKFFGIQRYSSLLSGCYLAITKIRGGNFL